MPELPEVETVRRGLAPYLEGARIDKVTLNRKDLRGPFPKGFIKALEGQAITSVGRRAKYLLFHLSSGKTWLGHLGMTGAFRFAEGKFKERSRYYEPGKDIKHDHVVMSLTSPTRGKLTLIYSDARRFGFMDLVEHETDSPYLEGLGPAPLGNQFNAEEMAARFKGKKAPMKAALLDQRVVAGLGNIYESEALWRAHIRPLNLLLPGVPEALSSGLLRRRTPGIRLTEWADLPIHRPALAARCRRFHFISGVLRDKRRAPDKEDHDGKYRLGLELRSQDRCAHRDQQVAPVADAYLHPQGRRGHRRWQA